MTSPCKVFLYFLVSCIPTLTCFKQNKTQGWLVCIWGPQIEDLKTERKKKHFLLTIPVVKIFTCQIWPFVQPVWRTFFCIMYSLTELNTNLAPGFEKPGPWSRPQNGWSPHLEQSLTKKILNVYHNCLISHMISSIFVFGWALVHHMGTGAHCPKNNPSLHA